MKTFKQFVNESIQDDGEKFKNLVIEKYKDLQDYSQGTEVEWDDINKLFIVWVVPFNEHELFDGKTGTSESHPKDPNGQDVDPNKPNFDITYNYDYIIVSKYTKNNDPACWLDHEKGHIQGFRKGEYDNKGKPFIHKKVMFNDMYPNEWYEFTAFTTQIKALLKKYGKDYQKIVDLMMEDYEISKTHEGNINDLRKFKDMFIYYLNLVSPNDDVVGKVKNQYRVKLNSKDTSTFDNYKFKN
jgi:hypothetical protein